MKEGLQNNPENLDKKAETLSESNPIADEIDKATLINKEAVRTHMLQDGSYIEAIDDLKNNSRNLDYSRCCYP